MYISHKLIGRHLRTARERKGLTQDQVAERLDVSAKHYGHIERGARKASLEMLGQLCEVLDVSLEELLAGALLNPASPTDETHRDGQIRRVNEMMKGCSDQMIDVVAEVVESITRLEKEL